MKLLCIVSSPIDVFAGYGGRSRDFAKALFKVRGQEWDIKFLSQRWGSCSFGALDITNPEDKLILDNIIRPEDVKTQPDIWIQISVSDEFQPFGKVNIGVSALVETNVLPVNMLEGLNRMNFNIVSSHFSKQVAAETSFDKLDERTKQKVGTVKLEKPIEVLFEGVDTTKYKKVDNVSFDLSQIKEEFCYLMVGHWLAGDTFEDRKQITTLIYSFLHAFKGKKKRPGLLLKTGMASHSIIEEEQILDKIDNIRKMVGGDMPNIYFLHGELSDNEMNELYNHPKVKAFALVGNEGFGRPYLEFSAASSKPIIASPWSGHTDFLHPEYNIFIDGKLDNVHSSAANQFLIKESRWFKADPKSVSDALVEIYDNYSKYAELGKRQGYRSRTEFSWDKMVESLDDILTRNVPKISRPVPISLPKLNNITKPDIEYLEDIK
jgi:glycosyltransferase involved in cell wall biosynthesis